MRLAASAFNVLVCLLNASALGRRRAHSKHRLQHKYIPFWPNNAIQFHVGDLFLHMLAVPPLRSRHNHFHHPDQEKSMPNVYKYLFIESRIAIITILPIYGAFGLYRSPASGALAATTSTTSIDCAYCCYFIFQCERDVVKMQTS